RGVDRTGRTARRREHPGAAVSDLRQIVHRPTTAWRPGSPRAVIATTFDRYGRPPVRPRVITAPLPADAGSGSEPGRTRSNREFRDDTGGRGGARPTPLAGHRLPA